MKIAEYISRLLVGSLFIVSGLIKANDPLGFSYKLQEYFSPEVLGMEWLGEYALPLAVFICVAEILLGIAVVFGEKMIITSWALLMMIVFFTFLTFYSAYFNKVTDCGCFGDALHLTPWQSFSKDVVLLFFTLIIFVRRKEIQPNSSKEDAWLLPVSVLLIALFSIGVIKWSFPVWFAVAVYGVLVVIKKFIGKSAARSWVMASIATVITTGFSLYCLANLPIKDFRPYRIGNNISELMKIPEGAQPDIYETTLVYKNKKTGELVEYSQEEYMKQKVWENPDMEWVETKTKLIQKGYEPPIHDFEIIDADGNDITEDILNEPAILLVISYDITHANESVQPKINKLAEEAFGKGIPVYGITASLNNEVETFKQKTGSNIDYFNADAITLKTIIRSNPGIVLLKNGTVAGKWHYNNIPETEEIQTLLKETKS
ncbi:MAG: DoxX family membrane protein [Bacteroidetes bacterium]|nr:MAG: DoxX family membrane protein [Bacteroidota bacterium]